MAKEKFRPITASDLENLESINIKIREAVVFVSKILEENGIKESYIGPRERICTPLKYEDVEFSMFRLDKGFNPEEYILEIFNFMRPLKLFDLRLLKLPNRKEIEKFIHTDPLYEKAITEIRERRYEKYLELKKEFETKPKRKPKEKPNERKLTEEIR